MGEGEFCWEEGEERRILNSHLSFLLLGRPAALMKTLEQADCPTLLDSRGRERKTKKWEGHDETKWPKARLEASWFWTQCFVLFTSLCVLCVRLAGYRDVRV